MIGNRAVKHGEVNIPYEMSQVSPLCRLEVLLLLGLYRVWPLVCPLGCKVEKTHLFSSLVRGYGLRLGLNSRLQIRRAGIYCTVSG